MNLDEEIMIGVLKSLKIEELTLGRYTENGMVLFKSGPRPIVSDVLFAAEFCSEDSKPQILLRWMKDHKIRISPAGELTGAMLSNPKLARLASRWSEKNQDSRAEPVIDLLTTDNLKEEIRNGLILVFERNAAKKMSSKVKS